MAMMTGTNERRVYLPFRSPLRPNTGTKTLSKERSSTPAVKLLGGLATIWMILHVFTGLRHVSLTTTELGYAAKDLANFMQEMGCEYDGECPVGYTCAVARWVKASAASSATITPADSYKKGMCELIERVDPEKIDATPGKEECVKVCERELAKDEHYYQGMSPSVLWTEHISSLGRPDGCILVFRREPEGDRWKDLTKDDANVPYWQLPPSLMRWNRERFRHVIRVEPHILEDNDDDGWIAYCFRPCTQDADCSTKLDWSTPGFVCIEGACQRNPNFWLARNKTKDSMVLISAAPWDSLDTLENLVASARYWAPKNKFVIYNVVGLGQEDRNKILSWRNVAALEWPDGIPIEYPEHLSNPDVGAWKGVLIRDAVIKYKFVLWMDPTMTVTGPLDPAENIIQRTGLFLIKGQDSDMSLAHPGTYEYLLLDKASHPAGPHFSSSVQGHLYRGRYMEAIVVPNAYCSLDMDCIAPTGSAYSNHRYDQTTLSIQAYHHKVRAPHYTEYIASATSQLQVDLKKPSFRFIATSRQTHNFYSELGKQGSMPP